MLTFTPSPSPEAAAAAVLGSGAESPSPVMSRLDGGGERERENEGFCVDPSRRQIPPSLRHRRWSRRRMRPPPLLPWHWR